MLTTTVPSEPILNTQKTKLHILYPVSKLNVLLCTFKDRSHVCCFGVTNSDGRKGHSLGRKRTKVHMKTIHSHLALLTYYVNLSNVFIHVQLSTVFFHEFMNRQQCVVCASCTPQLKKSQLLSFGSALFKERTKAKSKPEVEIPLPGQCIISTPF